ncbi:DJ-1/PfpI family protein [Leifsonia poae]|uniref:DJ-1/PfpI family protein n=1 Tax=Leifsonia poae TaxID=110933 RepID=UPI001CBF164D|nr:DJ-1/PfpI family protein [Leifsonia poae]
MSARKNIAIFLFDGVEELDAAGPWEVLAYWARNYPEDGFDVFTFADSLDPITCAKGLRILPDLRSSELPALEVLIYPGGQGTRPALLRADHLAWVREQRTHVPLMASVCTGALVYAAAGILRNRPATTHWASVDRLSELDPTITVRPDDRFVEDGDTITSAGVSAGIDMALRLVERFSNRERARQVRRGIQYDPEPPV